MLSGSFFRLHVFQNPLIIPWKYLDKFWKKIIKIRQYIFSQNTFSVTPVLFYHHFQCDNVILFLHMI
uniref:Similar to GLT1 (NADH-dependent glutamate synthase 1 gene) n=1 Tax=Arundo donax TaxID=35708 RepID=A0A0A9D0J7_ARUDO